MSPSSVTDAAPATQSAYPIAAVLPWWRLLGQLLRVELSSQWHRRGDVITVLAFYFLVLILAPLGLGPASATLRGVAPGLVWIAALLSVIMAVERGIRPDHQDGSLEARFFTGASAELIMAAKAIVLVLTTILPLILVSPMIFAVLAVPASAMVPGALAILLGGPGLVVIGLAGAALTAGARQGGALLAVLLFPLQLPVLIFGAAALQRALTGEPVVGELQILAALTLFSLPVGIMAGAAALRGLIRDDA
ncbi:MAG: heme exporter protein CcmB [Pseudomonadota bacterium]